MHTPTRAMAMDRSRIRTVVQVKGDLEGKLRVLQLSPLAAVGGHGREALLDLARLESLPRRHVIATQGEPARSFAILAAGRVKLERRSGERVFPVGHRGPGETVGETALPSHAVAAEDAIVLDEVEALVLPIAGLRKLVSTDAQVRTAIAGLLVERHRAAEERLESLLLHGVEARLLDFLIASVTRWGLDHPGGRLIGAPFTHADIALLIGSTRETVTLLLGKLKRDNLIEFEKRRILIRDRAVLEQRAAAS